ncbi:hypothetical protein GOA99_15455 [Sinorhizobium meliloti]|nr:hypothetical protein [Sinorhizobium meliloti]MQV28445.1 hypothetical protein [Sinorhizobium meliloti]RVH72856.1 hypothetical protein CN198_05360 [Sinorhizobium meliloti]RVK71059.1 hypothetical protein CN159_06205 [Sinorhizobium meliloti]
MNVIDSKKLRRGARAENRTHFSLSRSCRFMPHPIPTSPTKTARNVRHNSRGKLSFAELAKIRRAFNSVLKQSNGCFY